MPTRFVPEPRACNLSGGCVRPSACIAAGRCTATVARDKPDEHTDLVGELRGQTADVAHALTELRKASSAGVHGSITWAALWIALAIVTAAALVSC